MIFLLQYNVQNKKIKGKNKFSATNLGMILSSKQLFFFAGSCQATTHWRDVILQAVWKRGYGLLQEAYQSEEECFVGLKRGGNKKLFTIIFYLAL